MAETPTPHAEMAATYAEQTDALIRAAFASQDDAETGRCYRPIVTLNGWVVGIFEDGVSGDRPNSPGFLGYVAGRAEGDAAAIQKVGRAVRKGA